MEWVRMINEQKGETTKDKPSGVAQDRPGSDGTTSPTAGAAGDSIWLSSCWHAAPGQPWESHCHSLGSQRGTRACRQQSHQPPGRL